MGVLSVNKRPRYVAWDSWKGGFQLFECLVVPVGNIEEF